MRPYFLHLLEWSNVRNEKKRETEGKDHIDPESRHSWNNFTTDTHFTSAIFPFS